MKKIKSKDLIKTIFTLFIICVIVSLLLAITNKFTVKNILLQDKKNEENTMKIVCPEAINFSKKKYSNFTYYQCFDKNKNIIGYIFLKSARGYKGDISVMVGIDSESNIIGMEIISQNETPGLGSNIVNPNFKKQFLQNIKTKKFSVKKSKCNSSYNIEAITGATISSNAVASAVNQAISDFHSIKENIEREE